MNQERLIGGLFAPKSKTPRQVRTIRVTDEVWEKLGAIAESKNITRADLLEEAVESRLFEKIKLAKIANNIDENVYLL